MKILGLLLTLLVATPVLADTPEQMAAFRSYQSLKADAEGKHGKAAAAAYQTLADTEHATRLPYVKAWCHQNAAVAFKNAHDRTNAEAQANAALAVEGTGSQIRKCHARARCILGFYLALTADTLEAAKEHYTAATELDPEYETAKEGLRDVNKAIEANK